MRKNFKCFMSFIFVVILAILLNCTYALKDNGLLSNFDISVDEENNLTTVLIPEIDTFLKNPYKGYSSEDAYSQVTGAINWKDSVDEYATEGYLRLNWYLFYKNTFIGPKDATDYNDNAYDWSTLFNLIKLYADHDMQLRFGVMTANTVSTEGALSAYKSNPTSLSEYYANTLTDLQMPNGSIIPVADFIPVITKDTNNKVKLTCGMEDCSTFDSSALDNYTHTTMTVSENDLIYKARNITPMWMFEGIPKGYDEFGNTIYSEKAVKWYLSKNNLEWLPKWDDENLINNINDFVTAMSNYLKNEEYNGKKLIDYISFVEVRSYGNYGENHIDNMTLTSVNNEFRNPFLCGYLDTSAHNYLYAYEKDENFVYPSECYFDFNGENTKVYNGLDYHLSYTNTIKYYINIGFEYYQEKYLKTYMEAFKDTNVRLVFNWFSGWDSDYYYDKGYVTNDNVKSLLEKHKNYLTIRGDSVFALSFGEGEQFKQANGISPTAFEYIIASYKNYYARDDYFPTLKTKILENNLCNSKYDCLSNYFIHVVENGRLSYMDYNYILHDYYQNYLNGVENDYLLDLDYLGNSLGYHFIMKKAQFTTKVNPNDKEKNTLKVSLNVVNDGVTYLYDKNDTKVYLALLETDSEGNVLKDSNNKSIVIDKFLTDIDPTTWKSSLDITGNRDSNDSDNWIQEEIELNMKDAQEGKYILALGLFTDFNNDNPTIKLGNSGGTIDNWYALGEIELANVKYNINYNSNGGNGVMNPITVNIGNKIQLSKNIFTKEGYTFNGWNTNEDGSGISYDDEQTIIDLALDGDSITLYAQWNKNNIITNNSIDYEGVYDGNFYSFNINIQPSNYSIKYSINNTNYDLNELPKFKDVGEYIINYKITATGYDSLHGSNKVKIYGIKEIDSTLELKDNFLLVKDYGNGFKNVVEKINIYSPLYVFSHYNKSGAIIDTDLIKTGEKINININNQKDFKYTISILGDVSGDGKINYLDYVGVYNHIYKNKHPESEKILLSNEHLLAADIYSDEKISYLDYVKIYNKIKELKGSAN